MDISLLKNVYLFEGLEDDALKDVSEICQEEEFPVGHVIFREGEAGDKLYMIIKGEIRISKNIAGVGEEALAILKEGAFFGEMALIDDFERSADAIANKSVKLYSIAKSDFESFLFLHQDIAYTMLWTFVRTLSKRLRETNEKIKAFFAMSGGFS